MKLSFLFIFLLTYSLNSSAQTFERCFMSDWAETLWFFEFFKDSTFKRTSRGHYGFSIKQGKYQIEKDSIRILSGYQNTYGTISPVYFINKDSSQIIDRQGIYSQIKGIIWLFDVPYVAKYPWIPVQEQQPKQDMQDAFYAIFKDKTIINAILKQKRDLKSLKIIDYYELNHKNQWNLQLQSVPIYFVPKQEIKENELYIEIVFARHETNHIHVAFTIEGIQKKRNIVNINLYKSEKENSWKFSNIHIE
jgi:hypothetical protein